MMAYKKKVSMNSVFLLAVLMMIHPVRVSAVNRLRVVVIVINVSSCPFIP